MKSFELEYNYQNLVDVLSFITKDLKLRKIPKKKDICY